MIAPWKKSCDQPRQYIKKQRHYFANKGPSSQSYGFSSGHVWMWELDYKESWASILQRSSFFTVQFSHPYMTTGKTIALTSQTFVGKVMSLLFNMLSRLVIALLPRSKCLLISWLKSPSAVILEPPKIKSVTVSIVSPSICHEVMRPDAKILVFWMLSFKPTFSLSSRGSLILHFLPQGWCHLHIWGYWYFSWQSWFQLVLHPARHFTWYTLHIS